MSRRVRIALLGALSALALAAPAVAHAQTLHGRVGLPNNADAFSIALTNDDGTVVSHLDPGTYTIVVEDFSTIHNFHLFGPGVNNATEVETTGTVTWTVTFTDGTYRFLCDPHATTLRGTFTVGTPPATKPAPKKLTATVGPGFTISLTRGGKRVTRLATGTYTITVRDRSKLHNFHLVGPGVNKSTRVPFVGTAMWKVTFRKGKAYRFRCDAHPNSMKGSFRTS